MRSHAEEFHLRNDWPWPLGSSFIIGMCLQPWSQGDQLQDTGHVRSPDKKHRHKASKTNPELKEQFLQWKMMNSMRFVHMQKIISSLWWQRELWG